MAVYHKGKEILYPLHEGNEIIKIYHMGKKYMKQWLSYTSIAVIRLAFGDEAVQVIKSTNAYLNTIATTDPARALQLAGFINEDPLLVCSLVETSKTRWLVGDGKAYVDTGHIFGQNEGERYVHFECCSTGNNYRYWGSYENGVGRSLMCYPIGNNITLGIGDGINPDYNTQVPAVVGDIYEVYMKADNGTALYSITRNGELAKEGSYSYGKTIVVPATEPLFCDKEAGVAKFFSPMKVARFKTTEQGAVVQDFVPCHHDNQAGMLDILSGTFYPNANTQGTFTIELTDKETA